MTATGIMTTEIMTTEMMTTGMMTTGMMTTYDTATPAYCGNASPHLARPDGSGGSVDSGRPWPGPTDLATQPAPANIAPRPAAPRRNRSVER